MPHECTTCGRTFADGSKEMLSGCPDCGGNKFQYHPGSAGDEGVTADPSSDSPPDSSSGSASEDEPRVTDEHEPPVGGEGARSREDRAQASARSTVVSEDELRLSGADGSSGTTPHEPLEGAESPDSDPGPDAGSGESGSATSGESEPPELSDLREELDEQFESIKIHDRGEYELNLMELYDREEHIIALQEDGRYVIDVPSSWRETDEPE